MNETQQKAQREAQQLDTWIVAVRRGDEHAFREIMLCTQRALRGYLAARCSNIDMVDELLQDTYITVFEKIDVYKVNGKLRSWIFGIAHNHLRHYYRDQKQDREIALDGLDQLIENNVAEQLDTAQTHQTEQNLEQLQHCIQTLTPRVRAILEKRYQHNLPLATLAQHFKKTKQALANILHKARKGLEKCMQSAGTMSQEQ